METPLDPTMLTNDMAQPTPATEPQLRPQPQAAPYQKRVAMLNIAQYDSATSSFIYDSAAALRLGRELERLYTLESQVLGAKAKFASVCQERDEAIHRAQACGTKIQELALDVEELRQQVTDSRRQLGEKNQRILALDEQVATLQTSLRPASPAPPATPASRALEAERDALNEQVGQLKQQLECVTEERDYARREAARKNETADELAQKVLTNQNAALKLENVLREQIRHLVMKSHRDFSVSSMASADARAAYKVLSDDYTKLVNMRLEMKLRRMRYDKPYEALIVCSNMEMFHQQPEDEYVGVLFDFQLFDQMFPRVSLRALAHRIEEHQTWFDPTSKREFLDRCTQRYGGTYANRLERTPLFDPAVRTNDYKIVTGAVREL